MMSPVARPISELGWDNRRGTAGTALFILNEAMFFVCLFFAYYYLGVDKPRWPMDEPPKLGKAFIMLAVLLSSSVVLQLGERALSRGKARVARACAVLTAMLGGGFLCLQALEYREHLKVLRPTSNAYGSIFYTITSLHGLHLCLGILMVLYAALLPNLEPRATAPYRPFHNAAMYWHFVDAVWVVIVALLYVAPNIGRG